MSPFSSLVLLQGRRGSLLARFVVRLLRALKIKVSPEAVVVGGAGLLGLALIGAAWSRNRKDGGAPLWPLVLPSLAMAALIFMGLARGTPPSVDMSDTESGEGAMAMASETPAPFDHFANLRYALSSGEDRRISDGFMVAGGMGAAALPVIDLMQEALTREGPDADRRVAHFLKVLPPERHSPTLLLLSLQGSRGVKLEAWCLLGQQGEGSSLLQLGAFIDAAGATAEDEPLLRRAVACVPKLQAAGAVLMMPHLRGLIERMCRPPHTNEDAWSSSGRYGDPLASMAVWKEAFKALWALSPEEPTKAFAWNLLEDAPFKVRNNRRRALSEIALPWTIPKSP
ncbi:MAG TPA: hypothetical protein PLD86_07180 [Vicinamibacteria bacterium]|nr:hypothetical protein [Vicinamibacteria bacterium]